MTNFKDFCQKSQQLDETNGVETNLAAITSAKVQGVLSTVNALALFDNAAKIEEFSNEVANYSTSDELISSLSEKIGKPEENESEQEFVERASNILREILKKKFKI
jgi:hypothetical protein